MAIDITGAVDNDFRNKFLNNVCVIRGYETNCLKFINDLCSPTVVIIRLDRIIQVVRLDCPIKSGND